MKDVEHSESPQNFEEIQSITCLSDAVKVIAGRRGLHAILPFTYGLADYPTTGIVQKNIPALRFTDGPKGINLGRSTCFPVASARGASWDTVLEHRIGQAMAIEAAAQGANALGSVCINLIRHPGWGRAQESFGADPVHVGAMGLALMTGIQSKGVMSVVKHFACNSIENSRFKVSVNIDKRSLHEIYLPHFKLLVDAGAAGIMSAYNKVNDKYCGHHTYLLKEVLKKRWQFQGFVMSDFVLGIRGTNALSHGLDLEMPQRFWFSRLMIKYAIRKGDVTTQEVIDAANRVVNQLSRFNLSSQKIHPQYSQQYVACAAHQYLALESAQKSCVLLKNENQVLPFKKQGLTHDVDKVASILVVGPLAKRANLGSPGSVTVSPPSFSTLLDALKATYSHASISYHDGRNKQQLQQQAAKHDLVIVTAGLFGREEGEYFPFITGGDRVSLELPDNQIKIIDIVSKTNQNHVVVLYGGSSIACGDWVDQVKALLFAWYPGMKGGQAVAQIIAGEVNPSGRLPMCLPKRTTDLPTFDPKASSVTYDLYHDYRWFQFKGLSPAFHFGYGLSYTQFKLSALHIDCDPERYQVNVTLQVSNIGLYKGATVVQIYLSKPPKKMEKMHSMMVLKEFLRLELEAGESKQIHFALDKKHFAWFNSDIDQWQIDAGLHNIYAAQSLNKLDLHGTCEFINSSTFYNV